MLSLASAEAQYRLHDFERIQLSDQFYSEGATAGDLNRDGHLDLISGPYWYAGPNFSTRSEYYPAKPFDINGYSDNFFAYIYDFDKDNWPDILIIGFPGKEARWYRNPHVDLAAKSESLHWEEHLAFPVVDNESPTFTDVTGDGQPELVFHTGGQLGYAEIPSEPSKRWKFTPISPNRGFATFNHGLGVGDINGDGKADVIEKEGWWEQPSDLSVAENWEYHQFHFADQGGAQMLVYDVDGDGDNDLVTSKAAHAYGLSWFEQIDTPESGTFQEHVIMGEQPEDNDYGLVFSQLHALAMVDIDRDGVKDIVTGKRFWAHQGHDPGGKDPPVCYWFRTVRSKDGVKFVPYQIDSNSGVGTQVVVRDVNSDDWPDIIVGNKRGTNLLLHHVDEADKPTWEKSQPELFSDDSAKKEHKKSDSEDLTNPTEFAPQIAGRDFNADFENLGLKDWTATGNAFSGQPIWGDTVHTRRGDMVSGHQGNYWIGTYERNDDEPQGTLTSIPLEVTHPFASFYVGGGSSHKTRVEIVSVETNGVIFEAHGNNAEQMRPVIADLSNRIGEQVFLRIVDESSGHWGHINFDHFRFHKRRPQISPLAAKILTPDEYPHAGLSAEEAVDNMKVPAGFRVVPFASEPDVQQPIAMALDDRGRIWVAEAYEYPQRAPEGQGKDRILIFEDTDGDGRFDNRTVFCEGLNLVSGLEVGFGGVWVGAAPYLLFIPDANGDDKPDGEPEVLLDGWGYQDTHETLNAFIWGPDGWLYGCHGVFTHSRVGKPGTPDSKRTPINAGIWRYHPTRHSFEVFAYGTSNPWGVDFDENGQAVCTACVIPHLFHIIQGGRYHRQAGNHFQAHTYDDIKTIADHVHYLGQTPHSGNKKSDQAGGGHAHAGAMIYLGGAWPKEFRNQIFMNNIHGQRINVDNLVQRGSGFVGTHGPDFLLTQDLASQILNFRYGPDGQVTFIDWYDMQACHHPNRSLHDRSNGRIYKIIYGQPKPVTVDMQLLSDEKLVNSMLAENDWYVRHARRVLQERTANGMLKPKTRDALADMALHNSDSTRRLRALWALQVTGGVPNSIVAELFNDQNEYVRAWTIQLLLEKLEDVSSDCHRQLIEMASTDSSPVVRLYLCSAAQRVPIEVRWEIVQALGSLGEDADDHNLPLMIWYAAEPLAETDPERATELAISFSDTLPLVRDYMFRRIASLGVPSANKALLSALASNRSAEVKIAILREMRQALEGQRQVTAPESWPRVYTTLLQSQDSQLREEATALGVKFGDLNAFEALRGTVTSDEESIESRRGALDSLLAAKDPGLAPTLQALVTDKGLVDLAISGLAQYEDTSTPKVLIDAYTDIDNANKRRVLATLASRSEYAMELLNAIKSRQIPNNDLTSDLVRQLHNLKDEKITELIEASWGSVRSSAGDKAKLVKQYQEIMKANPVEGADLSLGRAIFAKTCQACHTLYGTGNDIGPDLTGSNRSNVEYLASNIADPGALIAKEYQSTIIITDDGRVVTGVVTSEDDNSVTIRNATDTLVIPQNEIDERSLSETSLMPDDQLRQFSDREKAALFAYLRGRSQVPLLATKENASQLFNGTDLSGWHGEEGLWSVENGELIGKSPGLSHNSFLLSDFTAGDFDLSFEVKLTPNAENSGVQFRSQPHDGYHAIKGYQADIGAGWWGKLYEEHGRNLLWKKPAEEHVNVGSWNSYRIRAVGHHVQTWINGNLCVDLDDPTGQTRGIFALQIHAGGPLEVRFRKLQLSIVDDSDE